MQVLKFLLLIAVAIVGSALWLFVGSALGVEFPKTRTKRIAFVTFCYLLFVGFNMLAVAVWGH